jgi:hypothetical protein
MTTTPMSTGRSKPTRMTMRDEDDEDDEDEDEDEDEDDEGVGMLTDIDSIFLLWNRPLTIFT